MTTPENDELQLDAARLEQLQRKLAESPQLLWENVERLGELRYRLEQVRASSDTKDIWHKAEAYRAQERRVQAVVDHITNIIGELLKATEA